MPLMLAHVLPNVAPIPIPQGCAQETPSYLGQGMSQLPKARGVVNEKKDDLKADVERGYSDNVPCQAGSQSLPSH